MKRFLFGLIFFISFQANASHVIGGDITYKNLGGDTFEIYLNLISDCALQTGHPATATINISGACPSFNFILVADSILPSGSAYQEFIEHGCSSAIGTGLSYCNGGNLPGYRRTTYTGIVSLPQGCGNYTLGYQYSCCPPPMVNVSVTNQSVYVETTIKDEAYYKNTGPRAFTQNHIPAFYLNQQASYDFGFEDPDGDSLFYEFAHAKAYPIQPAIYNAGYSFQQPIPGMTIDSLSGLMQFVPTTAGNYRVAVKVSEYDPFTDSLKSTVIRDLLFLVHNNLINQTINLPSVTAPNVIRNIYPSPNNKNIKICLGDSLKFDMAIKDLDGDSLEVFTNLQHILPGATITASTPFSSDSVYVSIRWLANQTFNYRKFLRVGIVDDACPLRGYANDVYAISVFNSGISATSNYIHFCPSDTLFLKGNGSFNHHWQTLSGNAPFIACDTCSNTNISAVLNAKLLHTATIDNQCGVADTFHLSLKPTQKAQINVIDTFCNNNQPYWENKATPKGGVWLDLINNGWGLTLADTSGGWRTIRYAITDSVCGLPDTAVKQVYLYSAPSIVWTDSFEVCEGDTAIFVNTSSPPANGWGAAAINGWFNPKNGLLGKNTIVLILTDYNTYCRTHVFSHVFVHPKPAMTFYKIPPICEDEDSLIINQAIPTGGQYFGNAFTGNYVDPGGIGPGFHDVFYTYEDTLGCRDTISTTFKIDTIPPQPQIMLLGTDTLTSSVKGDIYRWFFNGVELSNQSKILVSPQAGLYELIVVKGTCESPVSSRFNYNPLGLNEQSVRGFQVYPNPSNGQFTLSIPQELVGQKAQIFNQLGQLVFSKLLLNTQTEIFGLSPGIYILKIENQRLKLHVSIR